ncbi:MAG: rhodanese-like domain-containing protein [Saprospiraceae bacterium]|nr:rhodanese-like domain-containing protein [Saprospiraceae bacterium]
MLNFFKSLFKNDAYENLQAAEFLAKAKTTPDAVLLDVRTPGEVAAGKLQGAKDIDFQGHNFTKAIGKIDKDKTYFVYCRSGVRSANACRKMHEMGFTKLFNLSGGYLSV